MAETRISSATSTDLANAISSFEVATATTEGVSENNEHRTYFKDFPKWLGYYKNIPKMRVAIDAKARWTVGRGYMADEVTTMLLDRIKGYGKESFNTILENMHRVMNINGDSFAEIILDDQDVILNLKPIDPLSMVIVSDRKGMIIRYEQIEKTGSELKTIGKFKPERILHFTRNRTADEVHGVPFAQGTELLIESVHESMLDWRQVLHLNVAPIKKWTVDTDDPTEIATFTELVNTTSKNFENIVIPKGTVDVEIVATAPNQTMNPLPWITELNNQIQEAAGVPSFAIAGSQHITEAAVKIDYLGFQQNVEEDQLYVEEQILMQLNLQIKLNFPASLENEALSARDNPAGINEPQIQANESAVEPNDQQVEAQGKK